MFLPCFEDVRGRNKHLKISPFVQINWAKDVKVGQRERRSLIALKDFVDEVETSETI